MGSGKTASRAARRHVPSRASHKLTDAKVDALEPFLRPLEPFCPPGVEKDELVVSRCGSVCDVPLRVESLEPLEIWRVASAECGFAPKSDARTPARGGAGPAGIAASASAAWRINPAACSAASGTEEHLLNPGTRHSTRRCLRKAAAPSPSPPRESTMGHGDGRGEGSSAAAPRSQSALDPRPSVRSAPCPAASVGTASLDTAGVGGVARSVRAMSRAAQRRC
mmetsp:Transcript_2416/g.5398  ORF Transcript_2416/g.5398 Transcript_2416/m.5398 type:complete len:223 (+) Transcript_2416:130-798(+)